MTDAIISKDRNHHHYWIENENLYETYETIRGLRYRFIMPVPGMPDTEHCTDSMITYMEKEYL